MPISTAAPLGSSGDAAVERSVSLKQRIIWVIETAGKTDDPSRYAAAIKQCEQIWKDAGHAGERHGDLEHAYAAALRTFGQLIEPQTPPVKADTVAVQQGGAPKPGGLWSRVLVQWF